MPLNNAIYLRSVGKNVKLYRKHFIIIKSKTQSSPGSCAYNKSVVINMVEHKCSQFSLVGNLENTERHKD